MLEEVYIITKSEAEKFMSPKAFRELRILANRFDQDKIASAITNAFKQNGMKAKDFCEAYPCSRVFFASLRREGTNSQKVLDKVSAIFGISKVELIQMSDNK